MTLDPDGAGRPVCHVETVGRTSELPRLIEIGFAGPQRDRIYLLPGGRERAHWVRAIRENGVVQGIDGSVAPAAGPRSSAGPRSTCAS